MLTKTDWKGWPAEEDTTVVNLPYSSWHQLCIERVDVEVERDRWRRIACDQARLYQSCRRALTVAVIVAGVFALSTGLLAVLR